MLGFESGMHQVIQAIQEQKESFQQIISAKDKLIKEFQNQLKKKDDQYTKNMKSQEEDTKTLIVKMREQYFALRDQSLKELEEVQNQFTLEVLLCSIREKNISKNRNKKLMNVLNNTFQWKPTSQRIEKKLKKILKRKSKILEFKACKFIQAQK